MLEVTNIQISCIYMDTIHAFVCMYYNKVCLKFVYRHLLKITYLLTYGRLIPLTRIS